MKNDNLLQILRDIGLDEQEANVYLSSLSLGPTTILKISRASGIKRTTVYSVIESLKEKGLMRIEQKGLKRVYQTESPEKLEAVLENRKQNFSARIPELMALYRLEGGESVMKYYTGLTAMQNIYMDTLKDIKIHEEYLIIANQDKWYSLNPDFATKYIEERAKLPIKIRALFQDSAIAQEHKKFEKNFNQEVKILPKGTPLNVDTLLLPKKLITFELTPPYMTVVIENKSIIELHREMFEIIWRGL